MDSLRPLRVLGFLLCLCFTMHASAVSFHHRPLQIYFIDVEGGQSTLFVSPSGQSLLIDAGWNDDRDTNRILAAAQDAGIRKLDYVIITHYHADHVGGVPKLAARIPIGTFIDHGENRQNSDDVVKLRQAYQQVLDSGKSKRIVAQPGQVLPIQGIRVMIVTADGNVIDHPVPGAGADNLACKSNSYPADATENARSVGMVITFGNLRILDLGDLTRDKELQLMCPQNKLGKMDIFVVSHHGLDQSDSPELVDGITPRVAIMNNGARKGGSPDVWDIIEKSPGLGNLWQLHFAEAAGPEHNVSDEFIANPEGPDAGEYLKITAQSDGSFEVFNSRTKKAKRYEAIPQDD